MTPNFKKNDAYKKVAICYIFDKGSTVDSRYSGLFGSQQFVRYIGVFRYIEFKFVTFLSILPKI